MEIKIELDLPGIISAAVAAKHIQPIVNKAIARAIESAITDVTGYRSEFVTALKTQLAAALPHGLDVADVANFQQVLNHALTETVKGTNAATVHTALVAAAKHMLPDLPARMKLSELIGMAREGLNKNEGEAFFAKLELSEYGGAWIYLDSNANLDRKHEADIRVGITKAGECFALKMTGRDMTPTTFHAVVSKFNGVLLAIYTGRMGLDIDMDADDVESAAGEVYDS